MGLPFLDSAGQFLGIEGGPTAQPGNFGNTGLDELNAYTTNNPDGVATGATTGTNYATGQVQGNSMLMGGLNAEQGQLQQGQALQGQQQGVLSGLQNQGFQLTPGDQTQYGQTAGGIANTYGQSQNDAANSLASRGLSNSGAAGATFSGIQGSKNQQLAQAQQGIMQQRYQNTQDQIKQQQQFVSSLNGQNNQAAQGYNSGVEGAVQGQYGRQVEGEQTRAGLLGADAGAQQAANNAQNNYQMQASQFDADHKPANFMDYFSSGLGQGLQKQGSQAGSGSGPSMGS